MKDKIKNFLHNIKSPSLYSSIFNSRITIPPVTTTGLRLHLGCGDVNILGWVNIDARSFDHVHLVDLDLNLNSFVDHSVQAIYLCHVLEHFPIREIVPLLKLFKRKLCIDGYLYLSVPDFAKICDKYHASDDISAIHHPLMGGQDYQFNYHKSIYDFTSLSSLLISVGFNNVHAWDPHTTFGSTHKDYSLDPLSLNVAASSSL